VRPPLLGILAEKNGFQLTVAGDTGHDYHLEFSDDLNVWLPLTKVTIPDRGDVAIDLGHFTGSRYYRAIYKE
jgi:hypothetical protein